MEHRFGEIISSDVDWITATSSGGSTSDRLFDLCNGWIGEAIIEGNSKRPWGMAGFHGYKCGPIQTGTRGHEVLVRLSSHGAAAHWREVAEASDNCSRLDLQVTVRYREKPARVIHSHYKQAARKNKSRNKENTLSVLSSNNGTSTLYFNKRISDQFARIYDKGAESNDSRWSNCVRYELELKGKRASSTLFSIRSCLSVQEAVYGLVAAFFAGRAVYPKLAGNGQPFTFNASGLSSVPINSQVFKSTAESTRKLEWLRSSVAPTVGALVGTQGLSSVLEALGLDQLVHSHLTSLGEVQNLSEGVN